MLIQQALLMSSMEDLLPEPEEGDSNEIPELLNL
jgi:hypothetical protein